MCITCDSSSDKFHHHSHRSSGVQDFQQVRPQNIEQGFGEIVGMLFGEDQGHSSMSCRDVGFYIWYVLALILTRTKYF